MNPEAENRWMRPKAEEYARSPQKLEEARKGLLRAFSGSTALQKP